VLEEAEVSSTFTVRSSDFSGAATGSTCRPSGGYGDINSSTQVVVTNGDGEQLARTSLDRVGQRACGVASSASLSR
jgi:hypothetical protein